MENKNLKSKLKEELNKDEATNPENENKEKENLDVLNPETFDSISGGTNSPVGGCDSFVCGAYKDCGVV